MRLVDHVYARYKEAEAAPAEEYKVEDVTPEDYKEPEAAPAEEVAADYKTEDYKAEEAAVPEDYKEAEAPKEAEPAAEHKEADDSTYILSFFYNHSRVGLDSIFMFAI